MMNSEFKDVFAETNTIIYFHGNGDEVTEEKIDVSSNEFDII